MLLRIFLIIVILLVLHTLVLDLIAKVAALLAGWYWWMTP